MRYSFLLDYSSVPHNVVGPLAVDTTQATNNGLQMYTCVLEEDSFQLYHFKRSPTNPKATPSKMVGLFDSPTALAYYPHDGYTTPSNLTAIIIGSQSGLFLVSTTSEPPTLELIDGTWGFNVTKIIVSRGDVYFSTENAGIHRLTSSQLIERQYTTPNVFYSKSKSVNNFHLNGDYHIMVFSNTSGLYAVNTSSGGEVLVSDDIKKYQGLHIQYVRSTSNLGLILGLVFGLLPLFPLFGRAHV